MVYLACFLLPQAGQPPIDTPHGNDADKDGLKEQEYPVQCCPSEIFDSATRDPQLPLFFRYVTVAVTTGFVSLIFSKVIVGGGLRGLGWVTAVYLIVPCVAESNTSSQRM